MNAHRMSGAVALWVTLGWLAPALGQEEPRDEPDREGGDGEAGEVIDVTVSGRRGAALRARSDETSSSTVVPVTRLRRPGASASGVLSEVPGAQVSRTGSSAELATVSLRGAASSQTLVYLGGIRLNDDVTGTADLSRVPLWAMDRIEVHRGATPRNLDTWSIGGAVLLEPRIERELLARARVEVGSFGRRGLSLGGATGDGDSGATVSVEHQRADNDFTYLDDGGTAFDPSDDRVVRRLNADHSHTDAWLVARTELFGKSRLTTLVNVFDREQGTAGVALLPAERARARTQRQLFGLRNVLPCGPLPGCELTLSSHALLSRHLVSDPDGELGGGTPQTESEGLRLGQSVATTVRVGPAVFGTSLHAEHATVTVNASSRRDVRRRSGRVAGSAVVEANDDVTLALMAGASAHGTRGVGAASTESVIADGRFGIAHRPLSGLELRANVSRAARPATLGELYGISAGVRGNPALQPEQAWSVDAGASLRSQGAHHDALLDAVAFHRWTEDLVAFRRSSFGTITPYNVGEARYLGVETQAYLEVWDVLRADLALTWLEPRDTSPERTTRNDLVPFQSRLTSFSRLSLGMDPPGSSVNRVELGTSLNTRASRVADPAGLIVLPGNQILGIDARCELFDRGAEVSVAVENVTDQSQIDVLGFPLPGRSVTIALTSLLR